MTNSFSTLLETLQEIATLGSVDSLVNWDEQVMLKPAGIEFRAKQSALLARMVHERLTSPRLGEILAAAEAELSTEDPASDSQIVIREFRRDYDRAVRLPSSLIAQIAHTTSLAQSAWVEARKNNHFATFAPWLGKVLDLKRQEASCLRTSTGTLYDALLEGYEPGETVASLNQIFSELKPRLVALIQRIVGCDKQAPIHLLHQHYPSSLQEQLTRDVAGLIGFDQQAGRIDVSVHPFCTGIAPGDTRITTRYDEHFFNDAFFGTLHETGHALYEQQLPKQAHFGTALAEPAGLGIHESQSRFWENFIGRSRAFWSFFYPKIQRMFAPQLNDTSFDDWLFAINQVRPSFIRTEADEATYNLHILLRFELEQQLINGNLSVQDLPIAWNERFKAYLGLTVPDDTQGCLQDVHWSAGLIGYFPTYSLGNMYAAQFFTAAEQSIQDLDHLIRQGQFRPLLEWLAGNIHVHGRRFTGRQLVRRVTGKELSPDALLNYLENKALEYYGV